MSWKKQHNAMSDQMNWDTKIHEVTFSQILSVKVMNKEFLVKHNNDCLEKACLYEENNYKATLMRVWWQELSRKSCLSVNLNCFYLSSPMFFSRFMEKYPELKIVCEKIHVNYNVPVIPLFKYEIVLAEETIRSMVNKRWVLPRQRKLLWNKLMLVFNIFHSIFFCI